MAREELIEELMMVEKRYETCKDGGSIWTRLYRKRNIINTWHSGVRCGKLY